MWRPVGCTKVHNLSRLLASVLFALFAFVQQSHATFISLDSEYGDGSITLDTATGLEWIDPWLPIVNTGSGSPVNTYNDVLGELSAGGRFDGFRFARGQELNTLLYDSAGFDQATSLGTATASDNDKIAAAHLISFFDHTFGFGDGPYDNHRILDALYDSGDVGQPGGVYISTGVHGANLTGGSITYYEPVLDDNPMPYGYWLVRESTVQVPEPPSLLMILIGLCVMYFFNNASFNVRRAGLKNQRALSCVPSI